VVIRISGNQGVGYQEIRRTGKRIDADFGSYCGPKLSLELRQAIGKMVG
jgi:hypothetical protein